MDIKQILNQERIRVGADVTDWEEAIREVGQLLVNSGGVEERYVDGMLKTANDLGPYIVIAPGLAIPHARPEDGVLQTSMAVLTLADPVEFGHEENDPVHVLIAFAAVDNKQHLTALSQMAEVLSDPDRLDALKESDSVEKVLDVMWSSVDEE